MFSTAWLVSTVPVAGRTPEEVSQILTDAYGQILRNPQVEALVATYGASQIYVGGEVRTPGVLPLRGQINTAQAVMAAGGKVATLLDLSDVTMTIFLPTRLVGRVRLGADARIVLDAAPDYVVPAKVTFVSSEAQFTPKTVETADEREKLMYRVKVRIDSALLDTYRDYVKAGLTGDAYVLTDPAAAWPDKLAVRLPSATGVGQ